jgi:hypothetical protein
MTQWLVIERPASRSGSWSVTPRRPADSAAAASEGSIRGRLLAAVRVRVAACQLGPIATPASAVTPVPAASELRSRVRVRDHRRGSIRETLRQLGW